MDSSERRAEPPYIRDNGDLSRPYGSTDIESLLFERGIGRAAYPGIISLCVRDWICLRVIKHDATIFRHQMIARSISDLQDGEIGFTFHLDLSLRLLAAFAWRAGR